MRRRPPLRRASERRAHDSITLPWALGGGTTNSPLPLIRRITAEKWANGHGGTKRALTARHIGPRQSLVRAWLA